MPEKDDRRGDSDDSSLDERLQRLKSKLDNSQLAAKTATNGPDNAEKSKGAAGVGQAFRLSSEFIAGVVVGAGIGYLVDTFFGTSPWGLIVFLLLGFAAAVLNVMRAAGMVAESQMRLKPAHDMDKSPQDGEIDDPAEK
ncbi:MAG: F0F1 ATP synthase assembly protein I [Rhizobiaceae bacterium]|nr:F0F1 ATP synthase assembly protein I [Rhizobiaceae bacterium]